MTARNTTARTTRKTRTAQAVEEAVIVEPIETNEPTSSTSSTHPAFERFAASYEELMTAFGAPSGRRLLASTVVAVVASFSVGWLLGKVALAAAVGAMLLSGWTFLFWLTLILGIVLAFMVAARAGNTAFDYIAGKKIDEHAARARNWVRGIFGRGNDAALA